MPFDAILAELGQHTLRSTTQARIAQAHELLNSLAAAWNDRPPDSDCLGNPAFHRLFLASKPLRPRLAIKGSGMDWFAISAEWEAEGIKLTAADLLRLQTATGTKPLRVDPGLWVLPYSPPAFARVADKKFTGGFYANGLPFGLEISARSWKDGDLLGWAYAYEQATRNRRPPVLVEKGLLPDAR